MPVFQFLSNIVLLSPLMDLSDRRSVCFLYLKPSLRHMLCAPSHRENDLSVFEWFRSRSVLSGNNLDKLPKVFI